jgi:hypothetical protein
MAKSLLPPEAVMVDGVGVEEALAEVVPTEPAVVVLFLYTGAVVGALLTSQ